MAADRQGNWERGTRCVLELTSEEVTAVVQEFVIFDYVPAVEALVTAADGGLLDNIDVARGALELADRELDRLRAAGDELEVDEGWLRERIWGALGSLFGVGAPNNPDDARAHVQQVGVYVSLLNRVGWPGLPPAPVEDDEDSSSTD